MTTNKSAPRAKRLPVRVFDFFVGTRGSASTPAEEFRAGTIVVKVLGKRSGIVDRVYPRTDGRMPIARESHVEPLSSARLKGIIKRNLPSGYYVVVGELELKPVAAPSGK